MAIFSYRATTIDGTVVEGAIEAADEKSAIERLRNTGVIPLKLYVPDEGIKKKFSLRSSRGDLLTFTTELSALLGAGLPLDRSLNILAGISESKEMKTIIQSILKSIREGSAFSDALQKHPRVFPQLYVNMVRAGEAGGVLDVVLIKLYEFLEASKELREFTKSAMIYPAILLVASGFVIIFFMTFVLPKFSLIFEELGSRIPLPTQIVLAFSNALKSYWWIILLVFIGGWVLFRQYTKSDSGRYTWDTFKLKLMGDVIRKLETARFCRTLGTLLKSGVPLLQALHNSRDVISNLVIASSIDAVSEGVKQGKGIAVPLSNANVFPPLALSMIKVGEETGQLDEMLIKVATTYERSLTITIKRIMSLIEPVLIVSIAVIVGFIVFSMYMAIMSVAELPI